MIILGFIVAGSVLVGIAKGVYGLFNKPEKQEDNMYNLKPYEGWIITQKINNKIKILGLPELMTLEEAKKNYDDIMFYWEDTVNIPQISFVKVGEHKDFFESYIEEASLIISDWKSSIYDYQIAHETLNNIKNSIDILKESSVLLDNSNLDDELKWHEQNLLQKKQTYDYLNNKIIKMRDESFEMISKLTTLYEDSMFFNNDDELMDDTDEESVEELSGDSSDEESINEKELSEEEESINEKELSDEESINEKELSDEESIDEEKLQEHEEYHLIS